jgi:hypothetical protein
MKYLYTLPSGPLVLYPRQDDEPIVGLDTTIFTVLLLQQDPMPEYDPATHYLLQQETITLGEPEGLLHRTWEKKPIPSSPKWVDFAAALMANPSINQLLGNVFQVAPGLYGGLSVGLGKAAEDPRSFLFAWTICRQKELFSPVAMAIVVQTAQACNLPEEFISSLSEPNLARVAASFSS